MDFDSQPRPSRSFHSMPVLQDRGNAMIRAALRETLRVFPRLSSIAASA
jgi:hypothetical protein